MSNKISQARSASITPGAGIDSLVWRDEPLPVPGPGEVRVRIHAASLNYRDLLIARGLYPLSHNNPITPVSDGAGVVDEVGPGVSRLQPGQRVVTSFMRDWVDGTIEPTYKSTALGGEMSGVLAEYVVLPQHALALIPDALSYAEAAALPCAGVTAWNALCVSSRILPGQTVLVQGSGGVAVFALQIAHAAGARIIATTSSDAKAETLKALGADAVINYRTHANWPSAVLDLTGGVGVHHVIEIGGPDTLNRSLESVRSGGTVSIIGILTGIEAQLNLAPVLFKHIALNGIFVGSRQMLEDLMNSDIHPVLDRSFRFEQAADAYRYLESGAHLGKVILEAKS